MVLSYFASGNSLTIGRESGRTEQLHRLLPSGQRSRLPRRKALPNNVALFRNIDTAEVLRDPSAADVGALIRYLRSVAGMTQADLAARVGINQPALSDIENGSGRDGPSLRVMTGIAGALNRDLAFVPRDADQIATVGAARVAHRVMPVEDTTSLVFGTVSVEGSAGLRISAPAMAECRDLLVGTLLDQNDIQILRSELADFTNYGVEITSSGMEIGLFTLAPQGSARLAAPAPAVLFSVRGHATAKSLHEVGRPEGAYICRPHESFELSNESDSIFSCLFLPAHALQSAAKADFD